MMQDQEFKLLQQLLFDKQISRNRQFDAFEGARHILQLARRLRRLYRDLQDPEIQHWVEPDENDRLRIHLHHAALGALRTVFLTPLQWSLMNHPGWSNLPPNAQKTTGSPDHASTPSKDPPEP